MAYYAFLDENNIVTEVIAGKDETDTAENWEQFYGAIRNQVCKRTSYNTRGGVHYGPDGLPDGKPAFRKNYAGIGYIYDFNLDAFYDYQPFPSWILDLQSCLWNPPIPYPNDSKLYVWDENIENWKEIGL
jgi:hypothetical protein